MDDSDSSDTDNFAEIFEYEEKFLLSYVRTQTMIIKGLMDLDQDSSSEDEDPAATVSKKRRVWKFEKFSKHHEESFKLPEEQELPTISSQ